VVLGVHGLLDDGLAEAHAHDLHPVVRLDHRGGRPVSRVQDHVPQRPDAVLVQDRVHAPPVQQVVLPETAHMIRIWLP